MHKKCIHNRIREELKKLKFLKVFGKNNQRTIIQIIKSIEKL